MVAGHDPPGQPAEIRGRFAERSDGPLGFDRERLGPRAAGFDADHRRERELAALGILPHPLADGRFVADAGGGKYRGSRMDKFLNAAFKDKVTSGCAATVVNK